MNETRSPDGIDSAKLEPWLAAHVEGATPPFVYTQIVGGASNMTYRVDDAAGNAFVLRRPPNVAHVLATAHDVLREHRLIAALGPTPVPVPPALASCDDPEINGAPFFIMRFVDGVVLDSVEKAAKVREATRRALSEDLFDVLAELHSVDLDAVGLSNLARHEGYLARQVKRWSAQWEGSKTQDLPVIERVAARLRDEMPEQRATTIVHGDFRFGNMISDVDNGKIAAVLDWELCTLGDPMADLGHLAVYWYDASSKMPQRNDPTSLGGFATYDEMLQRYASRTGRDVSGVGYYRAFAAWRLAVIAEGVADRNRQRRPDDTEALRMSQMAVQRLAEFALAALG